jgi:colanic acid/amylovoran biosynthesis glycosyltransferase
MKLGHEVDIFAFENQKDCNEIHGEVIRYKLLEKTYYFSIPKARRQRLIRLIKIIFENFLRNPVAIKRCLDFKRYGRYYALNNLFKAEPFIRKRYDIIHCHFGTTALECLFLKNILKEKVKYITTFHAYDITKFLNRHGDGIYKNLFEKGDLFLPISDLWKKKLERLGCPKEKIIVHRMGVDTRKIIFRDKLKNNNRLRILTVARLVEKKGLEYSLAAIARIIRKYPEIKYYIVGDGYLRNKLNNLITTLNMQGKIRLLGNLKDSEVNELLQESDIFVLTSTTSKDGDQEGVPVSIMEAMAAGLPVISTYHSGIPELVIDRQTGFLVPEKNIEAITKRLEQLINHSQNRLIMGKSGRELVEKEFCINKLNKKLIAIYSNLVKHNSKISRHKKINIVLFWFMNDWGKYGRAYEKIAESLSKISEVRKLICIFPPLWINKGYSLKLFLLNNFSKKLFLLTPNARFISSLNKPVLLKSKFKDAILSFLLNNYLKAIGLKRENTIFWVFPPNWYLSKLVSVVPHNFLITQIVDNNAFRENRHDNERKSTFAKQQYEDFAKMSDMIITSSQLNYELFRSLNPNCYQFRNAVDEIFISEPSNFPYIINKTRPKLGYVGSISQRTDIRLLDYVARRRPAYDLVIAGPQEENINQYGTLNLPNVFYKGTIPYSTVPQFLETIDVCLIPHKDTYFSRSMDPLKIYQYLGSGRPVVSTPIAGLEQWNGLITIAYTNKDFVEKIDSVLHKDNKQLSSKRIQAVAQETWQKRVNEIFAVIMQHLEMKQT